MSEKLFPPDARMVFCIGAQKAGTTWLYETLRRSPQVHFSRNKELHYFDVIAGKAQQVLDLRHGAVQTLAKRLCAETGPRNKVTLGHLQDLIALLKIYEGATDDHSAYLRYLLENYDGQPVVCDITPAYAILDRDMFQQMGQIGSAKFIFILRDPVDRMWSQIRMAVKTANIPAENFQIACEDRVRALIASNRLARIERADYRRTITELEAALPPARIHYLFYETLFQAQTITRLCKFLGIEPPVVEPDRHSNRGTTATLPPDLRVALQIAFAPQYTFVQKHFGAAVPEGWACPEGPPLTRKAI